MKNIKTIIGLIIAFIIGISTTVGAATIFRSEDITYSSDKTEVTNVKDSLDELYSKVGTGGKCLENYIEGVDSDGYYFCKEPKPISIAVNVGDYVSMTPTSTSYTLPDDLSGCDGTSSTCVQNTINPSELNLWRVISKNEDGTVDVVSEYVSSKKVYFRGQTGWNNYLKGLNTIAAQYTNEKYVQSTRSVENSSSELSLISGAVGSLVGYPPDGSGTSYAYYLATVNPSQSCGGDWRCYGVYICIGGITDVNLFRRPFSAGQLGEATGENAIRYSVRPIVTLKSTVKIGPGDGKSAETAYQLI